MKEYAFRGCSVIPAVAEQCGNHLGTSSMTFSRRSFLVGAACAALEARRGTAQTSRWIDVHMHLLGGRGSQFAEAAGYAIEAMDRFGIEAAVVFPPPMPMA